MTKTKQNDVVEPTATMRTRQEEENRGTSQFAGLAAVVLMSAVPLLNLVANNPSEALPYGRMFRYWVVLAAFLIVIVALVHRRTGAPTARRVAVVAALWTYVLGFLAVTLSERLVLDPILGVNSEVWLAAGLMIGAALVSRWRVVQTAVPIFAALAVLVPLAEIASANRDWSPTTGEPAEAWNLTPGLTPNVYAFILDGYGRLEILSRADIAEPFAVVDELEERGFGVATRATTGYSTTALSISSVLSGEYLFPDPSNIPQASLHPVVTGNNQVVATLRSWGYSYVHAESDGWLEGKCSGWEDICLPSSGLDEVDWTLLQSTPFERLIAANADSAAHARRADPRYAIERLRQTGPKEPFFALFHLFNPHPPYTHLGEDCQVQEGKYNLATPWVSDRLYGEAVQCLNHFLVEAVDQILSDDPTAVIVFHGDHGPRSEVEHAGLADPWTEDEIAKRLGIFAALRLPSGCSVPDDLASVNIYRLLFDCLSDESVEMLPARSWMIEYVPMAIWEVTPPD